MGKIQAKSTSLPISATAGATVSLEGLVREQGVQPVFDLDALGELWPTEDDPDAFLRFVQSERNEARVVIRSSARKLT